MMQIDYQKAIELHKSGVSWKDITERMDLDISPGALRVRCYRFERAAGGRKPESKIKLDNGSKWLYQDYFKILEDYKRVRGGSKIKSVQDAEIKTRSGWAFIVFTGDWHLGSFYVKLKELESLIDFVADSPDVYAVFVGDMVDNFRRFRSTEALFGQLPPNDQFKILASIIDRLTIGGKIAAATWGNHDVEFDERNAGFSYVKNLMKERTTFFDTLGKLRLKVDDVVYNIGLTHHYKGESIYNPNHSHIRFIKEQFPDSDIVATGHKHFPASNWFPIFKSEGQPVPYMIQCGSPKDDPHSARYYGRGLSGNHYFLLNGYAKKLIHLNDVTASFSDILKIYNAFISVTYS
ncbi:MAG: hypothetical protein P8184_16485 [Calditrichia bacterium]